MDLELLRAAECGNVAQLEKDQDLLLHVTPKRNTALHITARHGHRDFAEKACNKYPALLTQQNLEGDTALHVAARAGHDNLVQFFVNCGKKSWSLEAGLCGGDVYPLLRKRNKGNNTPLHYAAQNGHVRVVELLMIEDPVLLHSINLAGESSLYLAAERGHLEVVTQMLAPNVGRRKVATYGGPRNMTALHISVIRRHFGVTRKLVEVVPQLIKWEDRIRRTPLHYAADLGDLETVRHLLQKDSSVAYCSDIDGRYPIHMAASADHVDIIKELLEHCPDCYEVEDRKGRNALHAAVSNGNLDTVRYILGAIELEALLNAPDQDGNTAFHLASINFSFEIMCLLANDERVNIQFVNNKKIMPMDIITSQDEKNYNEIHMKEILRILRVRGQIVEKDIVNQTREISEDADNFKDMTNATIVVAALIATVTFTAIFTMPGGFVTDGPDTGKANLRDNKYVKFFLLSDALAMFTSVTAAVILIFSYFLKPVWLKWTLFFISYLVLLAFTWMCVAFILAIRLMMPGKISNFMLYFFPVCWFLATMYMLLSLRSKFRPLIVRLRRNIKIYFRRASEPYFKS